MKNGIKANNISERLMDCAVNTINLINILPRSYSGRYIGSQLLRSVTSSGANYEEACGAESKADFVHKLGVVLKELRESSFWLRLIKRTELLKTDGVDSSIKEVQELSSIVAKSILTSRKKV